MGIQNVVGNCQGKRSHWSRSWKETIKMDLEKQGIKVWTGLNWLVVRITGGHNQYFLCFFQIAVYLK
jgi:hypothetical protein